MQCARFYSLGLLWTKARRKHKRQAKAMVAALGAALQAVAGPKPTSDAEPDTAAAHLQPLQTSTDPTDTLAVALAPALAPAAPGNVCEAFTQVQGPGVPAQAGSEEQAGQQGCAVPHSPQQASPAQENEGVQADGAGTSGVALEAGLGITPGGGAPGEPCNEGLSHPPSLCQLTGSVDSTPSHPHSSHRGLGPHQPDSATAGDVAHVPDAVNAAIAMDAMLQAFASGVRQSGDVNQGCEDLSDLHSDPGDEPGCGGSDSEDEVDMESQTWRSQQWHQAVEMLKVSLGVQEKASKGTGRQGCAHMLSECM